MRWYAMSAGFLTDPKVEALGEKHGPAGPLVIVSLMARAALEEKGGQLETTYRSTAHETFTDRDEVSAILDSAVASGLCHEVSRDVTGCVLTFPAWQRHQATGRKAKERATKKTPLNPAPQANVTDSHSLSRDVPYMTVQDKTVKTTRAGDQVSQRLERVTDSRSLPSPDPAVVAKIRRDFSAIDLEVEADKFAHWWTDGPGEKRELRDVVGAYRNWLRKADEKPGETKPDFDPSPYEAQVTEVSV